MEQEQKQFIIKALQTGIPALAKEHIEAFEEVIRVSEAKQEDIDGQEGWNILNQTLHSNIINTLRNSVPFMANEYILAYVDAVNGGQAKFNENIKIREEKEKDEAEKYKEKPASDKNKKSA